MELVYDILECCGEDQWYLGVDLTEVVSIYRSLKLEMCWCSLRFD